MAYQEWWVGKQTHVGDDPNLRSATVVLCKLIRSLDESVHSEYSKLMEKLPFMDIRFPANKEDELLVLMKSRAAAPWRWQARDTFGGPPNDGCHYFHRDRSDPAPACTLCILRKQPGHLVVQSIVPDLNTVHEISQEQHVRILHEFDNRIAEPATEALDGMTSIDTATYRLEDYFSPEAVRLLERFCTTSNRDDLGKYPSDQEKWIGFLICVHGEKAELHCDIFGECLRAKQWLLNDEVDKLVHEYDFALRLLRQRGEDLCGMTSIGTAAQAGEDPFSQKAIQLLERFCRTSNRGDLGTHLSDQEKWMAFLLYVHSEKAEVPSDIFGKWLRAKQWWPDYGIKRLVDEYNFAMQFLRQRDR